MDHADTSLPKVALDVHAELGPAKRKHRPTISRHEKRQDEAKIIFHKILSSRYREKYNRVGALFVTWAQTDLVGTGGEVNRLRSVFNQDLGYATEVFEIPSEKSQSSLNKKVADFVLEYDDPHALMVLYYAGHGMDDGASGLAIAATDGEDANGDDPQASFSIVVQLLHAAQSDVLLIIDCCFAANAFNGQRYRRRRFELFASSMSIAPAPGRQGSFTDSLISVMIELRKEYEQGFSTATLYSRLYNHPALWRFKPILFDQSIDCDKICIRPQESSEDGKLSKNSSEVSLNLHLKLSITKKDDIALAITQLAKNLEYLPYVQNIELEALHAGDEDVESS